MKKIVSILLSFVTVMSISSVTAFATETKFNRYEQIRLEKQAQEINDQEILNIVKHQEATIETLNDDLTLKMICLYHKNIF